MKKFNAFLLLILLLPALSVAEQSVNPGINRNYEEPNYSQWKGIFERDGREVWDRRDDIIRQLRLEPGQRVADVGSGTGFFALLMATEVGKEGHVYAVDIARNFVEATEQRAREAGLANVTGVVNDQNSVRLPAKSVDLVFISDTYHHFEYPQSTLQSIRSALVDDGELVVIDFERNESTASGWVMNHVRAGAEEITTEIEAQGFKLIEQPDFLQAHYYLRFRKTPTIK